MTTDKNGRSVMFALMQTVKGVSNSKGGSNREVYSKNIIKYEEQYLIKITSKEETFNNALHC